MDKITITDGNRTLTFVPIRNGNWLAHGGKPAPFSKRCIKPANLANVCNALGRGALMGDGSHAWECHPAQLDVIENKLVGAR